MNCVIDFTIFSKGYLTINTLSRSQDSITFEHKWTFLWKSIISFVKLDWMTGVYCQRKCFETQCLLMMPYLLHFYVCVMLWLHFTVSYCLIRITRASGPLFFAYHVALNNTSLLDWGTSPVYLVTIHKLYLFQHLIHVIPNDSFIHFYLYSLILQWYTTIGYRISQ